MRQKNKQEREAKMERLNSKKNIYCRCLRWTAVLSGSSCIDAYRYYCNNRSFAYDLHPILSSTIVHVDPQINTITNSLSLSHILFDKMTKITCGMTTYTLHYNIELKTPLNKSLKATFPADCSFQSKQWQLQGGAVTVQDRTFSILQWQKLQHSSKVVLSYRV